MPWLPAKTATKGRVTAGGARPLQAASQRGDILDAAQ